MITTDFDSFLGSWGRELSAQADRVRQLIGDAHWLSDGHHKESILRTFLAKYLPNSVTVGSGFAVSLKSERRTSPEMDVLICSFEQHTPYLIENGFLIVPPQSVMAHLEVKTRLQKDTCDAAFLNIGKVRQTLLPRGDAAGLWTAAVFYESEALSPEIVHRWIRSSLAKALEATGLSLRNLLCAPVCVVAVGSFVAFLRYETETSASLRVFWATERSLAFALVDLFSSIRGALGGVVVSDIDNVASESSFPAPDSFMIDIKEPA